MFDANARADLLCIALVIISFRRNPYVFKLSLHNLTDEAKLKLRLNFQIMNAAMLKKNIWWAHSTETDKDEW